MRRSQQARASQNAVYCCRGTYGTCFSTTLGSVCHELGHTFDLGHPQHGIMGRGFDNVHLVFSAKTANMVRQPPSQVQPYRGSRPIVITNHLNNCFINRLSRVSLLLYRFYNLFFKALLIFINFKILTLQVILLKQVF